MKRRKKRRSSGKRGTRTALALLIVCVAGIVAVWLIPGGDRGSAPTPPMVPPAVEKTPKAAEPEQIGMPPAVVRKVERKKIAILIDDIGYDPGALRRLLAIDAPLAFSVLPRLPHSRSSAEAIHRAGREVLLHLPMEPHGYPDRDPGRGALFASMTAREIRKTLEEDMKSVPHAEGVNNHMGSKFMEAREALRVVFDVLSGRGLYFVDSLTTEASAARELAGEKALPFTPRDLFIDDAEDRGWARAHLEKLLETRNEWHELLLIGHPYPETVAALEEMIPQFKSGGIEFVPLSTLVESRQSPGKSGPDGNKNRNRTQ
ncbi:MAG: divergent polysaccharide deacetylase family protein [Syntrophaceae bacterium]